MLTPSVYSARRSGPDAGESLQSDVMRFMAILSLCLVAIFTLVQTLPPIQSTTESAPENSTSVSVPSLPEPILETPLANSQTETPSPETTAKVSTPIEKPTSRHAESEPVSDSTKSASPAVIQPVPAKAPTATTSPENNASDSHQPEPVNSLTLRFASDDALVALLTQRRIDVYAKTTDAAWVLKTTGSDLHFAPTTSPNKFHQMSADTVPHSVIRALERDVTKIKRDELTFAVTLPPEITQKIRHMATQYSNGVLVIHADGRILHQGKK